MPSPGDLPNPGTEPVSLPLVPLGKPENAYICIYIQAGIKTAGRNINNLSYAADTTLIAERQAELKSLSKLKEKSENGLKLNIQKRRSWHLAPSFPGKLMEKLWKQ